MKSKDAPLFSTTLRRLVGRCVLYNKTYVEKEKRIGNVLLQSIREVNLMFNIYGGNFQKGYDFHLLLDPKQPGIT